MAWSDTPSTVASHWCTTWQPADALIPEYKRALLNVADSHEGPSNKGWWNGGLVSLQHRVLFYFQNKCGDCAQLAPANTGAGAVGLGLFAAGTADQLAGVGAQLAGASVSAIPIIGGVIGGIESIMTIFGHHSQAVQEEHVVNCQAMEAFNKFALEIDAAVTSGQLTPAQGESNFETLVTQVNAALRPVSKVENWGEGVQHWVLAHYAFRKVWYPTLVKTTTSKTATTAATAASSSTLGKVGVIAAGAELAHLGGLF